MDQTLMQTADEARTSVPHSAPLISVALAVYNGGQQLRYAIQSVLDQTLTDWELLIIDDGSSDGSVELIQQFSDPRIKLICDGQNLGLAARLNQAIDLASGQFFARMDHDDICHPERFARQTTYLQAHPDVDLLCTECVTMNEASELLSRFPVSINHAEICRRPWLGFYMPHPTWMGKLSWFRQHRYACPGPYCSEDQELLLRSHSVSRFHTYPETLLAYRVRTRTPWKKLWRTRLTLCKVQMKYFHQRQQWLNMSLSIVATALRLSSDALQTLKQNVYRPSTPNSEAALGSVLKEQWQQHIQSTIAASLQHLPRERNSVD